VPEGWVIYRVRSGDTLSFLSSSRGVTLEQVMAVNCLTNERRIIVGQALYLPPGASVVQPPSGDNLNPNPGSNNPSPPPGSSDDEDDDADD
jgi:LysM repeat protein